MKDVEFIYIKNENGKYSKWKVDEYIEAKNNYFRICLDSDKSIITAIAEWKTYLKDEKLYSDHVIKIENSIDFAFTPFGTIKI